MYTVTYLFVMHGILDHKTWGQISSHKLKYNDHVCVCTRHSGNHPQALNKEAPQSWRSGRLPIDGRGIQRSDMFRASFPHQVTDRWLFVGLVGQLLGSQTSQAAGWLTDRQLLQTNLLTVPREFTVQAELTGNYPVE